jgi:outer membrane immunogenic protein
MRLFLRHTTATTTFLFGVAAATIAASGPAVAADLRPAMPVKAPPAAVVGNWAGAYIGIQGGGGFGRARQSDDTPFDSGSYDVSGGLAGITWGRNFQFGQLVLGIESDLAWASIKGSTTGQADPNDCGGLSCSAELRWLSTTRARAGWAFGGWLPYVTAGLASGGLHGAEGNGAPGSSGLGSGTRLRYGFAAGGGVEAMVMPGWSAKVEYLYVDFGDHDTFDDVNVAPGLVPQRVDFQTHIVRLGLNYRYDTGLSVAPAAAAAAGPLWSGSYIGIVGGGGFGQSSHAVPALASADFDVSGGIVGGTIGFTRQFGPWVLGLENDFSWTGIKGSGSAGGVTFDSRLKWLETLRLRAGYAYDRLMPYVTAGVALGEVEATISPAGAPPVTGKSAHGGWTAGAGLEYAITQSLSAKAEYLYVDLGKAATLALDDVDFRTHLVRAGINYKYDFASLFGL